MKPGFISFSSYNHESGTSWSKFTIEKYGEYTVLCEMIVIVGFEIFQTPDIQKNLYAEFTSMSKPKKIYNAPRYTICKVEKLGDYNSTHRINWATRVNRVRRGGVVLVSKHFGKRLFGFGVDTNTDELTDFGGSIRHSDPTSVACCQREFQEETLGIFSPFPDSVWHKTLAISTNKMMILMLKVDVHPQVISETFIMRWMYFPGKKEVKAIVWLTEDVLRELIELGHTRKSPYYMFKKVRDFLYNAGDFYPLI